MPDYDNWCGNIKKSDLKGWMILRRIKRSKYLPCVRTFDAAILYNGAVRLCACRIKDNEFDELVVGNITSNSLLDIFNSSRAKSVRESFYKKRLPLVCQSCSLYRSLRH
jgi:radical SAM protein with 4Fe4S-binding SPASM domain